MSLENDSLQNKDESAANVVYHQQYDNKITEKTESFVNKVTEDFCFELYEQT